MTTVKELKAFLEQFPDETEVFVCVNKQAHWEQWTEEAPLDLEEYSGNWDFCDATTNPLIKEGHPAFGRKILTLGES